MEEVLIRQGRSLAETPTYSVASVVTILVFTCFVVERSIYRFGKWLKKTKRKALFASLEKMKEELMLLGLISLLLAQWARWISEICVNSSLFSSKFYLCSEKEYGISKTVLFESSSSFSNKSHIPPKGLVTQTLHQCGEGREPFVSLEGLEQLHRFLFVLGITHVLYSVLAVALAMSKIYSWRKWENEAMASDTNLQANPNKVMRRQSTFAFHHASHPWSRNPVLIWMLCFLRQFRRSIQKSDYLALRLGFITVSICICFNPTSLNLHQHIKTKSIRIGLFAVVYLDFLDAKLPVYSINKSDEGDDMLLNLQSLKHSTDKLEDNLQKHKLPHSYNFHKYMVRSMEDEFQGIVGISWPLWAYAIVCIFVNIHGLNIYFWLSFIPVILVMLVGTKLQHVVSLLALEIVEQTGSSAGTQVKPRDGLFWFGKPEILLRLIQFIIFQNAFEMATFIWSLWGLKHRLCFMDDNYMIVVRLASGVIVQFWCSYSTVPLNILITQMGSRCKKALVADSVRESLHSWCKRVKERSKRDCGHSVATRSVCSLDTTIDEGDEITVASGTVSRSSSLNSLNEVSVVQPDNADNVETVNPRDIELSLRIEEYLNNTAPEIVFNEDDNAETGEEPKVDTLFDLFQKT